MPRLALGIEYDGSAYAGWQQQAHARSVQAELERALTGELLDGPTHDFNLMWRRDRFEATLWNRPLVGPMVVFVDPNATWAIHLMGGRAAFGTESRLPARIAMRP